jgi:predicted DNA repair protein MutK
VAGSSLLTLLDDIASLLDDISVLSKVAAKKTAGVLGDDLALNAEQVTGVRAERELPVVWAVFKGSALNKAIMVPAALLLSALLPWAITPLLMIGGSFLCFEGFEKVVHRMLQPREKLREVQVNRVQAIAAGNVDMIEFEKKRIRGAIRTDAILSAEIIVIALGTVQDASLEVRVGVLTLVAAVVTVGVYGLVAGIVKLDDLGMHLLDKEGTSRVASMQRSLGAMILRMAPKLMKTLSVLGTAAMFLVGGGILVHSIPQLAHLLHAIEALAAGLPAGGFLSMLAGTLFNGLVGVLVGGLLVGIYSLVGSTRHGKPGVAESADHD